MIKTYNNYKPSGIEWLGDVPDHWSILRVKELSQRVKTGTTPSSAKGDFFSEGTENWFTPSDMNDNEISNSSRKVIADAFKNKELEYFPPYSIYLIGIGGTLGRIAISNVKASCNQQINVIIFNHKIINSKFAFYQMIVIGSTLIKWSNYTTMPIFTQTNTKSLSLALPLSLEEQTTITQYLDDKTQAIDKKIKLLTQKTDYYKELRKCLINDTVCKGLDKDVKLKESEFVFSVNAKWNRYRLKDLGFLYSGLSGKSGDDFNQDDNPNNKGFIPFTNIANNTYLKANHLGTVVVYENEKQNKVKKGDVFFLMSSEGYEDIGKTAALTEDINDTYLNSFCKGYRITTKHCDPNFINYLLLSDNYRKLLIVEGKGFTRINLKMEKVSDFIVYLPPTKTEQTQIAIYLDDKTQKIDAIVNNINKQVETLKELRKTLINDAVTGKIKVTK